ncbi:MAG: hypothetical protein V1712_00950 [Patescibacteria group bacterium]
MNKLEMGPIPETPNQKQELQSIYDRGIEKIKGYVANFEDNEVQKTAAHFEHLFNDVKKVAESK